MALQRNSKLTTRSNNVDTNNVDNAVNKKISIVFSSIKTTCRKRARVAPTCKEGFLP